MRLHSPAREKGQEQQHPSAHKLHHRDIVLDMTFARKCFMQNS